jgi:hypothetical protein
MYDQSHCPVWFTDRKAEIVLINRSFCSNIKVVINKSSVVASAGLLTPAKAAFLSANNAKKT